MVLLGVLAIRMKDQRLEWDSKNLRFTNNEEANALLKIQYREGWTTDRRSVRPQVPDEAAQPVQRRPPEQPGRDGCHERSEQHV